MFAPTLEEKQRFIYKCVETYNITKMMTPRRKKAKKRKVSKKKEKSNSDSKSILSKGDKEDIAGAAFLSQDLIGVVIEEEEQNETDIPRGRSLERKHQKMELIQTQTDKKRDANKSR